MVALNVMKMPAGARRLVLAAVLLAAVSAQAKGPPLRLDGYVDAQGAISVQHKGDTIDPYFTLQALLLASENGLDIAPHARNWANWLVERQKPDATFDRFCRNGPVWAACKTADADDALLALWLKFLDTMPAELAANPVWLKSHERTRAALGRLVDPARGVYLVSPVYQHGLFMDNLEVLSYRPRAGQGANLPSSAVLAKAIHDVFWDAKGKRFLVSTQPEQKGMPHTFYPEAVAQLFPLLFDYGPLPRKPGAYYQAWMREHRATWLVQSHADFAWGLVALVALRQGDLATAGCWLRETAAARRTSHWIVADEAVLQVLEARGVKPAAAGAGCR